MKEANQRSAASIRMDHYSCCLCRSMLPSDKRRRGKLHGETCKAVKEQLQGISVVPLANFEEIIDPSAYLQDDKNFFQMLSKKG